MRDLDWFDASEQEPPDTSGAPDRRRRLVALAAVPWLVVAALLVLPLRGEPAPKAPAGTDAPVAPIAAGTDAPVDPVAAGTDAPAGGTAPDGRQDTATADRTAEATTAPLTVLEVEELRGRWRVAPGEEELAALALISARAHLTGIGPRLSIDSADPPPDSYAEHLVLEAVEHPSPETTVVTVVAILLLEPTDGDGRVEVRRLAVPLAHGEEGPSTAGRPWELPPPSLPTATSVALEPVEDPALFSAADTALAVAGLGEQRTTALATAPGWPLVATTTGPDGEQQVWLRRHLDGLVVAGSTLQGAAPIGSTISEEERP